MSTGGGWMYAVMAAAGLAIPVMAAMNADLGQRVGAPTAAVALFAAAFAFGVGFAFLNGGLRLTELGGSAATVAIGGAIIAFYLLSITILAPKIGVGAAVFLVLLGQIVSAAVIDQFGLLGSPKTPIGSVRMLGVTLMIVGVILARRPV